MRACRAPRPRAALIDLAGNVLAAPAVDARIGRLRDFPGIGTSRDEIRPRARTLVHGRYLILHEHDADADQVEIVAVVEGMRDLDRLF